MSRKENDTKLRLKTPDSGLKTKSYGNQEIKTNIPGETLPDVLDPR